MTFTSASSFSFQPWTRKGAEEGGLKDILARVNIERGHFRGITEASLQEEIAAEGALELSESESDEDQDEDGDESQKTKNKPKTRDDMLRAKHEMLMHVIAAHQEVLLSLDFISLLESKDAPKQAQSTLSPKLKESSVPLGTLGTDLWQRMPVDKAREAQDELLATNVRMKGLQQSADSLLAAATSLRSNVQKETQYWSQILSISEEGWNICRIPGQQHRLGVSFGFSGSAPAFSRRGIAELAASSRGDIMLERAIGSKPKGLRAVLYKDGNVLSTSKLPRVPDPEETTLEARIRYARDSLFDEEVYYEMMRESRTIASLGVGTKDSNIELEFGAASTPCDKVSLDLVSLDGNHGYNDDSSEEQYDPLAYGIVLAARLLLGQAHRDRLKKRAEVSQPMSEKQKDENPILPILRPIMSFIMHRSALDQLNAYVETVGGMMESAHVESSYQLARFDSAGYDSITNAEALVTRLMQPWVSEANLSFTDPKGVRTSFGFKVQTTLAYEFGSVFTLTVLPGGSAHRFDTLDEVKEAADALLASALAKSLAENMDNQWKCNRNEALIMKDVGVGEKSESICVSFDSNKKMLSLKSQAENLVWKVDGDGPIKGFWDAKSEALS